MTTAVVLLNEAEARSAIAAIREAMESSIDSFDRAMALARGFEQGEGYRALGYRSMGACLANELALSRSRAYQLIDQMKASILISEETGEPPAKVPVRRAREVIAPTAPQEPTEAEVSNSWTVEQPESPAPARPAPIQHVRNGADAFPADSFDTDEAIYECGHCSKQPTTLAEMLRRGCLSVARAQQEPWD